MQIAKALTKREVENLEKLINRHYGCRAGLTNYHVFMMQDDKVWCVAQSIDIISFSQLPRCYRIGLYFGKLKRNGKIKLTIEGAQMIGMRATRNIVKVKEEAAFLFMKGLDVDEFTPIEAEINNFVLVKWNDDILGCGILRENKVESLISKARRLVKLEKRKDENESEV